MRHCIGMGLSRLTDSISGDLIAGRELRRVSKRVQSGARSTYELIVMRAVCPDEV